MPRFQRVNNQSPPMCMVGDMATTQGRRAVTGYRRVRHGRRPAPHPYLDAMVTPGCCVRCRLPEANSVHTGHRTLGADAAERASGETVRAA